ncbi:MAG: ATP-binding protein [Marinoscillum sp.]
MKVSVRYLIYGSLFGLMFPVVSSMIVCIRDFGVVTPQCLLYTQTHDILMWVIDTAPFFLGVFAYFVGLKQESINRINEGLNETVTLQTKGLTEMNNSLQREIEERKRREQELIDAREAAEEGIKSKDQFLSNMSHEIRTPMNGILGMANILLDTDLSESQLKYLKAIDYSAKNLLVIINDILDLSKINAEKLELDKSNFKIIDVFKSVEHSLRFKAQEKGIDLDIKLNENLPLVISGDPVRFGQILLNLAGNAVKFTDQGSVLVQCKLEAEFDDVCRIKVEVIDTGIGIEKDRINTIFESFTQASPEVSTKYGGTGFGLPISRRLIDLHNGTLKVNSKPGEGSNFTFTLDFGRPLKGAVTPADRTQVFMAPEKRSNVQILLVEDNQINQMVAQNLLTRYGFSLDIANHGKEAIEKVRVKDYDVILMDVQMPEMNGLEATRYIRTQLPSDKNRVKIIAMTASVLKREIEICLEAGMDDYIPKPYNPQELYDKIIRLVG